jgi:type VI secretion system ImpC/EvpB family protein
MGPRSAEVVPSLEVVTREAPPGAAPGRSLLDAVLEATAAGGARVGGVLERFLAEPSLGKALAGWLGPDFLRPGPGLKQRLAQRLGRDIARLDDLLSRQVNAILHHPRFQKLEAAWRGLRYLVEQAPEGENVKVRVLNVSWQELARDLDRALEFDQSWLFRKVYGDEFGMAGGEPFGVLLGDYEVHLRPGPDHPTDDVAALKSIAAVAAAAFAPFIAAAHPSLLDLESFTRLERPLNLAQTFERVEFLKWRALRQSGDARFVGLTLPRVLLRLPYADDNSRADRFRFREEVGRADRGEYLWGNAAYAFGAVLIRAFATCGWLADIRGAQRGVVGGGLVTGLPVHAFGTDTDGVAPKCSTEVVITDAMDKELGDLGFLPLCACPDTEWSAFYGGQSIQKPQVYDELPATVNARLSALLPYVFCAARFAHYLKVLVREKVGAFAGAAECEEHLRRWLQRYTNASDSASPELKARHPLRESRVQVRESTGSPGTYVCVVHLRPHFQLDQLVSSLRLVTRLPAEGHG